MKHQTLTTLIILLLCGFTSSTLAQDSNVLNITSEVDEVTIFLSGAEVSRKNEVTIKEGLNTLRFENISTYTDSRSIQFETDADIDLLSITMETDYLNLEEKNDKIKSLQDSIKIYERKKRTIEDELGALEAERAILNQNQKIGGDNASITVEEIQKAADFYKKRTLSINQQVTHLINEQKSIIEQMNKFNMQLREYNLKENVKNKVIIALIESASPATINTELKYVVKQCGWAPSYDLIAADISGKIDLKYKAKVFNNTGNDWNSVKVNLSTGDPKLSATIPNLDPWYLNASSFSVTTKGRKSYSVPQAQSRVNQYQTNAPSSTLVGEGRIQNTHTGNIDGTFTPSVRMKTIEVSELSTEFEVERAYTIPSDSKPYIVEIIEYELEGSFSHVSVPKLDKDAFLLAKITGWERLDLVPGSSNVYFSQTYVGESYINTRNVEDTLGLSFGRDSKILVTRKKSEEFSSKNVIGNWKKDLYTYEIIVKNNRNRNVSIELKDQIPVSQDSDISVSVENISDAKYDESNGELIWEVNLKPSESKKFIVSFEIKYPKAKKISVKKYRVVSAPSF